MQLNASEISDLIKKQIEGFDFEAEFIIALTGLEILIAFLQAYVFAILTCLYINDALHLH